MVISHNDVAYAVAKQTQLPEAVTRKIDHPTEQKLRHCMLVLLNLCDGAASWDTFGLNKIEAAKKKMYLSIATQTFPMTIRQAEVIIPVVLHHKAQLQSLEIEPPTEEEINAFKTERGTGGGSLAQFSKQPSIDIRDGELFFYCPYAQKTTLDRFISQLRDEKKGYCHWEANEKKEWRMKLSEDVWKLLLHYFPLGACILTESAQEYGNAIAAKEYSVLLAVKEEEAERKRLYFERRASIKEDLTGEFAPGMRLYKHQEQAINLLLYRPGIVADEVGLGKTFSALFAAKAMQKCHGWNTIVITTVSAGKPWAESAQQAGVDCDIYSWGAIPNLDPDTTQDFALIGDEGHYIKEMRSARTQKFLKLAFHPRCKWVILLTGTPKPNGRPRELYPLLYACRHPLVWHADPEEVKRKKREYERTFCGLTQKKVSGGRIITDTSGASNLLLLYKLTNYTPRKENAPNACIIARLKRDCLDMPPKMRQKVTVEISPEEIRTFEQTVVDMWDRFEAHVKEKLDAFAAAYEEENKCPPSHALIDAEEEKIRTAEAVVRYGIFRQAGAYAKIAPTVEMAEAIMGNDNKLVIFTSFKDVAHKLALAVHGATGKKIAVIMDETSRKERDRIREDFQSEQGTVQCIVCTAAAGEAITLTAAQYMIIVDRPWTPGAAEQWEGRIDRISQKGTVTVYWTQMPEKVTPVDVKVDTLLETKYKNIQLAILGRSAPTEAQAIEKDMSKVLEQLMYQTVKRIREER